MSCCSSTRAEVITPWHNIGSCNAPNRCGSGQVHQERLIRNISTYTGEICSQTPEYQYVACSDSSGCCSSTTTGTVLYRHPLMGSYECEQRCMQGRYVQWRITYRLVSAFDPSIDCGGTTSRIENVLCHSPADCYRY